jgi:hypothetical protein
MEGRDGQLKRPSETAKWLQHRTTSCSDTAGRSLCDLNSNRCDAYNTYLAYKRATDCAKWRMYRAAMEASPLAYALYAILPLEGYKKLEITLLMIGLQTSFCTVRKQYDSSTTLSRAVYRNRTLLAEFQRPKADYMRFHPIWMLNIAYSLDVGVI